MGSISLSSFCRSDITIREYMVFIILVLVKRLVNHLFLFSNKKANNVRFLLSHKGHDDKHDFH